MAPSDMPEWVGRYEIVRHLGDGGMGVVYEAKDPFSEKTVALKVLPPGAAEQAVARFKVEAEAAQRLDHPTIVKITDHGQAPDGKWFIAMELIDGISLDEHIGENGPLEPSVAARYAVELCEALHSAHEHQILHRDLKPHNVMLTRDGRIRLTDFGLAKLLEDGVRSLTQTGDLIGTPSYMSPEQARASREEISVQTDVYGLGGMLYHMLTGRVPFTGHSMGRVLRKIVGEPPRPLREIRPEVPAALEAIVLRCLEKKREDRYASMPELRAELEGFLSGKSGGGGGGGGGAGVCALVVAALIGLAVLGGLAALAAGLR